LTNEKKGTKNEYFKKEKSKATTMIFLKNNSNEKTEHEMNEIRCDTMKKKKNSVYVHRTK